MKQTAFLLFLSFASALPALAQSGGGDEQKDSSTQAIVSSIILAIILSCIFLIVFLILRPRYPAVYQPKSYRAKPAWRNTEPLPSSTFGWISPYLRNPDKEILRINGLDAYSFILFIQLMIRIFVPIWLLSWVVLMPLYAANIEHGKGLNMFAFGSVIGASSKTQQLRSSGVLILHYILVAWVVYNIHAIMMKFMELRKEFLTSPEHRNTNQAKTFLVTGVPNEMLSETRMKGVYADIPDGVKKVWINRNLKELPEMIEERDKNVNKLEGAVSKLIKTAAKNVKKGKVEPMALSETQEPSLEVAEHYVPAKKRPTHRLGKIPCIGEKVDTISYCREEIMRLNREISQKREVVLDDYVNYPPESSAFVLCNTMLGAYTGSNAKVHPEPHKLAKRYREVHPDDIVWTNMNRNPYERKARTVGFWALTIATIIFWTIPIALVSLFSSVDYLQKNVSFLSWIENLQVASGIPLGVIKAVLPTAALAILNSLLPPWLRWHAKQSGVPTRTGIELSLMDRFFPFQVIQNFIFLTILGGIQQQEDRFQQAIHDPADFVATIAMAIPTQANFFMQYVILIGLSGAAAMFLQLVPIIVYYVKIRFLSSTPRKLWHLRNDMGAPAFGQLYPVTLLITVLGFGYMILAPIMNGFAAVTFFTLYLAYRYLFLYVFDCKPVNETAGLFFKKAINQTFVGLYVSLFVAALMYLFNSGANQNFIAMGVLTLVLLVLVIAYQVYLGMLWNKSMEEIPSILAQQGQQAPTQQAVTDAPDAPPALPEKDAYYADAQQGAMVMQPSAPAHVLQVEPPQVSKEKDETEEIKTMNAFYHPSRTSMQQIMWYPNDNYGIGRSQALADQKAGYESTTEHAFLNEKSKIDEDANAPPGQDL
ncbi:unnamed protein product [Malassezia sympodialis ATCC 42132]|uniref:Uncharacterized protein n=1 Tax=Malassezia sympodialis (strain ATCC 42132) TaxID=1230383 RepID=M5EDM8_MALS4|nr:uncharacterized protein MSY001_3259 [Malassezia sympodialis ATCC 42132]CCV00554.1 unnamed protein product [Malassezia sympodialis ATCC 42132]SHO76142.1 Similar to S.cerevisiae protein RSN1 (Membrane protein of unknown function) [Malassezia sympodialis ATCC 42132]|eukprot:XP_018741741.1 uncharacterized protein MSY001_3259 [Malassezia sympodialis ATCC 42132]